METLCVTGHRPDGLPWKNQRDNVGRRGDYLCELKSIIIYCIEHGFRYFIAGGALGVDTDFAKTVLELKKKYPFITLEIAVPCPDQSRYWSDEEKSEYEEIAEKADKVTVLSPNYSQYCMHKRNKYMVDNSDCVLCCYNGANEGGTFGTIKYAERENKKLIFVDLSEDGHNGERKTVDFVYNITSEHTRRA